MLQLVSALANIVWVIVFILVSYYLKLWEDQRPKTISLINSDKGLRKQWKILVMLILVWLLLPFVEKKFVDVTLFLQILKLFLTLSLIYLYINFYKKVKHINYESQS